MDFTHLLENLLPLKDKVEHIYSIASLAISIIFLLWLFNLVASFIHRTYVLGRTFGLIYRKYIHNIFSKLFSQGLQVFKSNGKVNSNMQKI